MFLIPLALAASQASDNIPYHYVAGECAAQGDGHQPIFQGMSLDECEDAALADHALNASYKRAKSRLDHVRRIQLRNEQRRWIVSINALCDMLPDGSIAFSREAECFIREAKKRAAILRKRGL